MPLISIVRAFFVLLSLALLAVAVYLLWSWYDGDLVRDGAGVLHRFREGWRLWTGLGLLAWSFLGRFILPLLVARRDSHPTHARRGHGQVFPGGGGASLYVETHGAPDAPVIVMTHGWGLDSTIWHYAKQDLASKFRLVLWDLPGMGRSRLAKDGAVSLERFARDLLSVIERAGPAPVLLVGHSIGGMTIQTLARDHPTLFASRVAGVVLVNTTYTNPLKTMALSGLAQALRRPVLEPMMRLAVWLQPLAWLSAWQSYLSGSAHLANRIGFGRAVTASQLEQTTLLTTRNPPGALAKGNLAMFRWDATAALPGLACPALVIGGDLDIVTKLEASSTIAAKAPGAELKVVEGVNHMGFLERSDLYNRAIADFASAVQPVAGPKPAARRRRAPARASKA